MNDLISVIIPTYNPEKHLLGALQSIMAQTYKNIEVIVVDDGSKKPVEDMLKDMLFFEKITLIRQENQGAPVARNKGFSKSTGKFVIFWDDDIVGELDMLEKMHNALVENESASFAYSNFYFGFKKMPAQEFNVEELKKNNYIITTSLIRREDFPGFDEFLKRFQDWDLWLNMAEQGKKGVWIDEYLFKATPKKAGISSWLPSFAYKKPWKFLPFLRKRVKKYEKARKVIEEKYNLK
ncbi:MAG: hypothetical protein CO137_01645 [Candidatus Magasanikbacteria bacterium CG_4_9_14_3_um_filter_32_9]|uniref:Glycosyltransferase 2-like domain-containing protein n=1 Tax=Candidatus Magasanikbacteria bacterium CG_4_9_14_3_um_filter_32_9 TaxID=1974644 RepID=A0A2M7Z708_9BACT|nr:MAG: hypothetical protein CO137_01645 [Candidatus Magasanikbacteria bacterium CG_4_9_14_3_um_filter_32_9]